MQYIRTPHFNLKLFNRQVLLWRGTTLQKFIEYPVKVKKIYSAIHIRLCLVLRLYFNIPWHSNNYGKCRRSLWV